MIAAKFDFDVKDVAFVTPKEKDQIGFFHPTDTPIRILMITKPTEGIDQ